MTDRVCQLLIQTPQPCQKYIMEKTGASRKQMSIACAHLEAFKKQKLKEEKLSRESMTEDELAEDNFKRCSKSNRKSTPLEIIKLLEYIVANPTKIPSQICMHFTNLTTDQIKMAASGTTRLFPDEFPISSLTFEQYEALQIEAAQIKQDWLHLKIIHTGIKKRSLGPETIITILNYLKAHPTMFKKDVAINCSTTECPILERHVSAVFAGTMKIHELEFPFNGITYKDYCDLFRSVKSKPITNLCH